MKQVNIFILLFTFLAPTIKSQTLLDLIGEGDTENATQFTAATFKETRLMNGHTIETVGKRELMFIISHRFDKINEGIYEFFGLDRSTIRFGLDYGINDRFDIGIGRSNYQKLYDGFVKYKILRQASGAKPFPVTITYLGSIAAKTEHWSDDTKEYKFVHRLYYSHSLLIARKFSSNLSLQLMPVFLHRNLAGNKDDQNNVYAIGAGGRYKLTSRASVNTEYYYLLPGETSDNFTDSFSLGFDIETGGHIFQLHFTNSRGMEAKNFVAETTGDWLNGDIYLGFNITRHFSL